MLKKILKFIGLLIGLLFIFSGIGLLMPADDYAIQLGFNEFENELSMGIGFIIAGIVINDLYWFSDRFIKPHKISFVNAVTLISFGLWGYIDVDYSPTALIPVVFGVVVLALNPGLKKENKLIAHVVVILTFLILFGLNKPLISAIEGDRIMGVTRVSLMMLSTLMALLTFIKSFIANRSKKN